MGRWNHNYYIYLLSNQYDTVLYTGVTNDLQRRLTEHKALKIPGFTSRYKITKLVYYEHFDDVHAAIDREKQIKSWSRERKNQLVENKNPEWEDLFNGL